MGSEAELGSLCERLDEQLLRYLDEMEQLADRRERLERLMEQGWFSLSKARYSMGNKCVSSLQYGAEMVPLASVDVSQKEDGHYSFRVERVDSSEVQTIEPVVEKCLEIEEIGPKDEAELPLVRRRRKVKGSGEKEQELASGTPAATEYSGDDRKSWARPVGPRLAPEPLNWFGILVPQSLRLAQASFKDVMELAAEVATLQSQLLSTRALYQDLWQQKQKLVRHQIA